MKKLLILVVAVLAWNQVQISEGAMYRCKNKTTGQLEFQDRPCEGKNKTQEKIGGANDDLIAKGIEVEIDAIVKEEQESYDEICAEQYTRIDRTSEQYKRKCKKAKRKLARCQIEAHKKLTSVSEWKKYYRKLGQGVPRSTARRNYNDNVHLEGKSEEEALGIVFAVGVDLEDCFKRAVK